MKDKGFTWLMIINVILAIADIGLSIKVQHVQYLETNPIYPYVGFLGIIAINIIVLGIAYYTYRYSSRRRKSVNARYMLANIFVTLTAARALAITTAIKYLMHPITLEQAQAVTLLSFFTSLILLPPC